MQLNKLQGTLSITSIPSVNDDSSYYKENKSHTEIQQNNENKIEPEQVEIKKEIVETIE